MYLDQQDLRRIAGRMVIFGFDGVSITAELRGLFREVHGSGVIVFQRNIESPAHIQALNAEIKSLRTPDPILICVDQEGGRVQRVRSPATVWPPMRNLGETRDTNLAEQVGSAIGAELRAMNFDIDFAPVLDVDTEPLNPVIGDRSLSSDPEVVATLGAALIKGLQKYVGACGKQFPGHGDTTLDSHLELPSIAHDKKRLAQVEWPPFQKAIQAQVGSLMTAHLMAPAFDEKYPATLSANILGILRNEWNFQGVILSDDIEMKALADHYTISQIVSLGVQAGIDIFLACHQPDTIMALYRALIHLGESQHISAEHWLACEKRIQRWSQQFYQPAQPSPILSQTVGCLAHQALKEKLQSSMGKST